MLEHTVKSYDEELKLLDNKIAQMGGLAERQLADAFDALERRDPQLAERVIAGDSRIDELEHVLQEHVIEIIAKRQPIAIDLRQIMAVLSICGDLERIGDLAKNIAKRAHAIAPESHPRPIITGLNHMVELASRQLKDVLDAYSTRDADRAIAVWHGDSKLDNLYNSIFRELLTYMMEDPRNIALSTHLLFGAKNLERVGDHTTNIAENIHYLVTGVVLENDRPKGDDTSTVLFTKPQA